MTQYASPNSDDVDGLWYKEGGGQGALNSKIRKGTGDSTYITSENTASPSTCSFEIQNGDDPEGASDHIVRYRARATDDMFMGPLPLTVSLYQDASKIAEVLNSSVSTFTFTDYSFTLSTSEANAITDYDDLQLWFTRGSAMMGTDNLKVSEAYFEYPDAPTPAPTAVAKNQPEAFLMFID
jgi:hypothetical protein